MKYNFDLEDHSKKYKKMILAVAITLVQILVMVIAAYCITHFGLQTMTISGDDMSPTLKDGDRLLINKMSYGLHSVKRNDVVVVSQDGTEHKYYSVLRVIGLPGESVKIEDGAVYIDGEELKEKYNFPKMENGGLALEEFKLDDEEYFMLGDNRNECEDSRNANVSNILEKDIVGKAWLRLNTIVIIGQINEFD